MTITDANKPFADGIARLIDEKGLKQVYVADKAGYTPQELSDMLRGRRLIKASDIPKIAYALGVTSNEIYAAGAEAVQELVG